MTPRAQLRSTVSRAPRIDATPARPGAHLDITHPALATTTDPARRPHRDKDDARAVRTRQRLVAAFHEAVQDSDPSALSVSALTRRAGVNRTSFYEHFASPDDLAVHALADLFDVVSNADLLRRGDGVDPVTASRMGLREIVDFVWVRRASYARVLGPSAPPGLAPKVAEAFAAHAAVTLARLPQRPAEADPRLTAHFVAGGVLSVLGTWLNQPRGRWSRDRLVTALVHCLPTWVVEPVDDRSAADDRPAPGARPAPDTRPTAGDRSIATRSDKET